MLLTSALFLGCMAAMSSPLSPEAALARVRTSASSVSKKIQMTDIELKITKRAEGQPAVYVFGQGVDRGYIVVSADDSTTPLLGYSDYGTFPDAEEELPDGFRYWLGSLAEQVAFNSRHGLRTSFRAETQRDNIEPLVATKWNQSAPYNNLCPVQNNQRCVTGCVATAMSQVLKYYEYPTKGIGTYSYEWNNNGTKTTLSFDYGSTTFDWANMTDTYDSNSTAAQQTAVATLMKACGVAVDMNYTYQSSGAQSWKVGRAYIEQFGYDKGLRYLQRDYYTIPEWEDMIYDNLKNYGPVTYGGQSNDGGHEFVCDGYQNGYFHINWGWGGMSDGYFLITALDPDAQGIGGSTSGYNFSQDMVCYVSHGNADNDEYFYQMCWNGDVNFNTDPTTLGGSVDITYSFFNYSLCTIPQVYIGINITPTDGGEPTFIPNIYTTDLGPLRGWYTLARTFTIPAGLSEGEYIITPAFKVGDDGEVTDMMTATNSIGKYYMTVAGNNVTFAADEPAKLSASGLTADTDFYIGSKFMISATLKNESNSKGYQGIILAGLLKDGSLVGIGDELSVVLDPDQSNQLKYASQFRYDSNFTPTAGSYQLALLEEKNSSYHMIGNPIEIQLHAASTPTISLSNLKVENGLPRSEMKASATLTCTSGYFAGNFTLYIFPYIPGQAVSPVGAYQSEFISIAAPSSASVMEKATATGSTTVNWNFNFAEGEPNKQYFAQIRYGNSFVGNQSQFSTGDDIVTGIITISGDTNPVISREYITLTGVIVDNANPAPGIYVVRETREDGTITTRRVAIK